MNWTTEQQQAIDVRGKNILVAAAAGSGKTAVLVERIKKLIIEDGVPIDRMLIVTFTNAAAAEMKDKIRTALQREIEKRPEHAEALRRQLSLLPRASISTFHAFALNVIRKFFYLTDVEPGFSICDDARRTILKEEALDQLLEDYFAEGSVAFYDFLNWYSGDRNQNRIREIIEEAYNVLQSLPYPWQWLDEKVAELSFSVEEFKSSPVMDMIESYINDALSEAFSCEEEAVNLLGDAGLTRLAQKIEEEELSLYRAMVEKGEESGVESLQAEVCGFKSVRLAAKKEEKEAYESVKNRVSALRKKATGKIGEIKALLFLQPLEDQIEEIRMTAPKAETLKKLLCDFDALFAAAKAERKLLDFNDIEHICLGILHNEQAAEYYRNKFLHIFIDEYQDTNILQEEIIDRIKRENNLFMVGDIKQSIYKFRLAEPEIFRGKYKAYSAEGQQSMKIDLNRNFRSKPVILDEINGIFEGVMEDYDEDAKLYPGIAYDGPYSFRPQAFAVDAASVSDADEELADLKNTELEALAVCRLIKENLGKTFYDQKAGAERPLRLSDIAVLMRGVRNYADTFYNILKENGIESFVDNSEGYFDTMEINVFMNLLSVIDNRQQDIPLISVLHSGIFGFSADMLAKVRAEYKEGDFASSVMAYGENGEERELAQTLRSAMESLRSWREMSAAMPLGKFIWQLMLDTGYYLEMGAMPGGSQRQANLRALVDKAEKYSSERLTSLYSFVQYIDSVKERNVPMGQVKLVGENDDIVRIMTIHKSKGLEFPMVIVSGMGRKLNYTKIGKGVVLHKDIGIGMTFADYEGHWYKQTLLQRLIAKQVKREEVEEEIRILYVALTRARDMLFMTGTVKDGEKFRESRENALFGDGTYLDMAQQVTSLEILEASQLPAPGENNRAYFGNPVDWDIYDRPVSDEEKREVARRLSFTYPYEAARSMKSKYSVTELGRLRKVEALGGEKPEEAGASSNGKRLGALAVPKFRQGEKAMTAAERGTIYHGIMERIDFSRAAREGCAYVEEAVSEFVQKEIFTTEEIAAVELERICEFFQTELGRRCAESFAAGKLHRERPFDLCMEEGGEEIIVQGIIDCYFEEEDGVVLLDYKTGRIDPGEDFAQEEERLRNTYRSQIDIYRSALNAACDKPVKEAYLYLTEAGKAVRM